MYKHQQMRRLARLIADKQLPDDPDVDWAKAYRLWRMWLTTNTRQRDASIQSGNGPITLKSLQHRALTANSRARKANAPGHVTCFDLRDLLAKSGNKCKRCGSENHLVFDHIVPFYRGGGNTIDNIQVLCRICNMEKGVTT